MHEATKIEITRAEDPIELCGQIREFEGPDCWVAASSWLLEQGPTFPATAVTSLNEVLLHQEEVRVVGDPELPPPVPRVKEAQREGSEDRPAFVKFLSKYAIPARTIFS